MASVSEQKLNGHSSDPEAGQSLKKQNYEAIEELEECDHVHYSQRSGWLRAAVLGANDGLVSVASLLMGVSAAGSDRHAILLSGLSGLVGGAVSMALGEYVSVWSQKDAELADIQKEREAQELGEESRLGELKELQYIYIQRGLTEDLAYQVAVQLTEHDVIAAHARDELGIDLDDLSNPFQAAFTSMISFSIGAAIPLLASFLVMNKQHRLGAIAAVTVVGLVVAGALGSSLGGANVGKGSVRVTVGGILALAATFGVGIGLGADPA